jgi:hypothetical protein
VSRAAPMGLATFVVPAAAHACRGRDSDGGSCWRPLRVVRQPLRPGGPYNSGRYREQNEGYAFEREGNAPGVWEPSRLPVEDWLRDSCELKNPTRSTC